MCPKTGGCSPIGRCWKTWKSAGSPSAAGPMARPPRRGRPSACSRCFRTWAQCRTGPAAPPPGGGDGCGWGDGTAAPGWTPEGLFALFPNLGAMPHRPGGRISGGEQQMLTVARTLMGNPLLLLLDEPSEGVAPVIVEQMARMILELKAQGVSILLSEQNMHFAELVSDRAYVLEKGQIRYQASMAELAANEQVRLSCLGV